MDHGSQFPRECGGLLGWAVQDQQRTLVGEETSPSSVEAREQSTNSDIPALRRGNLDPFGNANAPLRMSYQRRSPSRTRRDTRGKARA